MSSVRKLLAMRARQALAQQSGLPSPCQSVCRIDPASGWCEGCLRTLDEIASWSTLDDEAKRGVWRAITERLVARH